MAYKYRDFVWRGDILLKTVTLAADEASKEGAEIVRDRAIKILEDNIIKNHETSHSDGHLAETINVMESKFKNSGWIVGVFADPGGEWERTFGAKAIFVEYGHAFPGQGRKTMGRGKGGPLKSVPPYAFMSKAEKQSRRDIKKLFEKKIDRALKK